MADDDAQDLKLSSPPSFTILSNSVSEQSSLQIALFVDRVYAALLQMLPLRVSSSLLVDRVDKICGALRAFVGI